MSITQSLKDFASLALDNDVFPMSLVSQHPHAGTHLVIWTSAAHRPLFSKQVSHGCRWLVFTGLQEHGFPQNRTKDLAKAKKKTSCVFGDSMRVTCLI